MSTFRPDARIYVAGHAGLVGSAIVRRLQDEGCDTILTATRRELDLRDQSAVDRWFSENRPEFVFLAAGKVGGIMANSTYPADFMYDNLMIHSTVIEAARRTEDTKLLYLGSSCIYPRNAPQPIPEEALLTGTLEPTNEGYALAKIAGIKMCQYYRRQHGCDFISAMPTNLYGPGDNFDLENSHVLPALLRKFHEAKAAGRRAVTVWGTGSAQREFLHVDDLADACVFLMHHYSDDGHINVGTGEDLSIRELAESVRDLVYPEGELVFDTDKPDGMPRKVLDVSRINQLGWKASTTLSEGLAGTYRWFLDNQNDLRGVE